MKNVLKKMSALMVVGLVACTGRTITRQEAIKMLQDIKAKQAEEGFVYATDFSLTTNLVMSAANGYSGSQIATLSYNAEQKRVQYIVHTVQDAGSNSYDNNQIQWLYVSDGVAYQATQTTLNDETTKYYEKSTEDVDAKWAEIVTEVQNMLTSNINETNNPDYFLGILNGELNLEGSTTTVTINTEHYTTAGDGNINASLVGRASIVTQDDSSGDAPQTGDLSVNFVFDNYRIIQSLLAITVDQTSTADEFNHMSRQSNCSYSNINIALPDLTGFTEQSAN